MSPSPADPFPDFVPGTPALANQVDARFKKLYDALDKAILGLDASSIKDGVVSTALLADGAVTAAKLDGGGVVPNGSVTAAKIEATVFTQYKTLHTGLGAVGPALGPGSVTPFNNYIFRIFAADLAVTGKTPMLRISAAEFVANVNPGVTTEVVLVPVTAGGGTTFGAVPTIGAVVGASANLGAPGANALASAVSADFALPADGVYMFAVRVTGGTTPNPCAGALSAALQLHHT